MGQNVAILGASDKPERFSFQAFQRLKAHGHSTFPVSPQLKELEGSRVYPSLQEIPDRIETLTVYVRPEISSRLQQDILALKPRRVIFNPGSENPDLESVLRRNGIEVLESCTLVLLKTNKF